MPSQCHSDIEPKGHLTRPALPCKPDLVAAGEKGPFILVGHSIGGPYGMAYTRKFGDEVAGLVFVDASHPDQVARFTEAASAPLDSTSEAMKISSSLAWTGIIRLSAGMVAKTLEVTPQAARRIVGELGLRR